MKMKKLICFILCLSICLAACLSACAEQADERALRLAAYREALETLYQQHRYPDGEEADFSTTDDRQIEDRLALSDADGDGQEELILHMMATIVAWQTEAVYC